MTGVAGQTRRAMPVDATDDHRPMRRHAIGLGRAIARGMTIETARMLQHLAGLAEQRDRARRVSAISTSTPRSRDLNVIGAGVWGDVWQGGRHLAGLVQFLPAITCGRSG
jgi:hypothetical protein